VALRCPGELTKDLTLKAEDSKFVLEDISRPSTTTLVFSRIFRQQKIMEITTSKMGCFSNQGEKIP